MFENELSACHKYSIPKKVLKSRVSGILFLRSTRLLTFSDFKNLAILRQLVSIMALKQIEHGSEDYHQMVNLRNEVLRKPLGLSFEPEELEREKEDVLIGAFEEGKILGCCMLTRINNSTCRLRQMAVHDRLQRKGIGHALMSFAENLARDHGYKTLMMHARKTAVGFYEKQGYRVTGDEFIEVTVPHYVMEKRLI
jgi:N-acetylglutamate synthase-like GNAT family acetyltransferase